MMANVDEEEGQKRSVLLRQLEPQLRPQQCLAACRLLLSPQLMVCRLLLSAHCTTQQIVPLVLFGLMDHTTAHTTEKCLLKQGEQTRDRSARLAAAV